MISFSYYCGVQLFSCIFFASQLILEFYWSFYCLDVVLFRLFIKISTDSSQGHDDITLYKEMITKQENELQTLRSECDLLSSELTLRKELTSELEVQVQNLEKKFDAVGEEAHGAAHKLNAALKEKKYLAEQVGERNCTVTNITYMVM